MTSRSAERTKRRCGSVWKALLVCQALTTVICLAAGCSAEHPRPPAEASGDGTDGVAPIVTPADFTANVELVRSVLGCDQKRAEATALVLDRLKIGRLDSLAEVESSRKGPVLIARAGDHSYVLFLREDAFLETVKADSVDGRTLYQVMY